MRRLFQILFALLISGEVSVWATDGISVANLEIRKNGEAMLNIDLTNENYLSAGFQFVINLPEGINVKTDNSGAFIIEKGSRLSTVSDKYILSMSNLSEGKYQLLCYTDNPNKAIPGTSGTVASIMLVADESLQLDDVLEASLSEIVVTETDGATEHEYINVPFSITITNRILLDETSTVMPESGTSVSVLVKRTIKAGQWSTIVLPFAMTQNQVYNAFGSDVELANFTGYETEEDEQENIVSINVKFSDLNIEDGMEANHPYIIKVQEPIKEFVVDNVNVEPIDDPKVAAVKRTKKQWSELIGTYVANTEVPDQTLFLSDNKFWYSTGTTRMKAFRAYFDFYDVLSIVENASSRISIGFGDEPTAVDADIATGNEKKHYDLQGRRAVPHRKGLYIVDKKKVVK